MHTHASRTLIAALFAFGIAQAAEPDLLLDVTQWKGAAKADVAKDDLPVAKWANMDKVTSLEAVGCPKDWSRFGSLRFWLYCPVEKDSVITLIATSDNPKTKGPDYFSFSFRTNWTGWREVWLPLARMGRARKPVGWSKIDRIFFNSKWAHHLEPGTELCIAGVTLSTARPPQAAKPAPNECFRNGSFEGDFNFDGLVNATDLVVMQTYFAQGGLGYAAGNANCDDVINGTDLVVLQANFGFVHPGGAPVPEPVSAGLFVLGAVALIGKRRR